MPAVALVAILNKATDHAFQHFCEGLATADTSALQKSNDPGTDVAGFCELSVCHSVGKAVRSGDAECGP
ncbi:hypothetical protein T11_14907 [Trichinella zimbabwensis]|uniref:Uncharacterized protein n=1 Tax=Trichinella zimbabwensis TaxID=268475 RepID=A0A0V1H3I3_9BILA|nr:hypothetical protein T11_14907 [Trichinella zimbabwensis]